MVGHCDDWPVTVLSHQGIKMILARINACFMEKLEKQFTGDAHSCNSEFAGNFPDSIV